MSRKLPAYYVYLMMAGGSSLFFATAFTVAAVYRVIEAGLNPFQLLLLGTALEATVFLCEIPTGLVADVYSRRLSIIIGTFLIGIALMIEGSFPIFWPIILAQAMWGLGYTFTSGAREAWIADELGEGTNIGQVYLRGAQASQVGAIIGTIASVALASLSLALPIVTGGGLFVAMGAFLILVMPERGFSQTPRDARGSFGVMGDTFRGGIQTIRNRPVLITILAIGGFAGMGSEAFDRLWEAHLLEYFTLPSLGRLHPIIWFGIINVAAMLLSIGVVETLRRQVDTDSHHGAAKALFAIHAILIGSVISFGLAGNFTIAVSAYLVSYLMRTTSTPIYAAWLNQSLEPRYRATVISMSSQVDALGQIIGGPILGVVGTIYTIRAAIAGAGMVLSPALLLFARTIRRPTPLGRSTTEPLPLTEADD